MNRQRQNEFDAIAGARLSKISGGIEKHLALSNTASVTIRNKLNRLGLEGPHIDAAIQMIDDLGLQGVLQRQSLGVRFSTMPQAKRSPKIWRA